MRDATSTTTVPRADLPRPIPARLCRRALSSDGVPVPYYAAVGERGIDFTSASLEKVQACVKDHRCWLCGDPLKVAGHPARICGDRHAHPPKAGQVHPELAMVIGPLEAVRRVSGFLPSHQECAQWWAEAASGLPAAFGLPAGAVVAVWVTRGVNVSGSRETGFLAEMGAAESVSWWMDGRPATQAEAADAITREVQAVVRRLRPKRHAKEIAELRARMVALGKWLPKGEEGGTSNVETGTSKVEGREA